MYHADLALAQTGHARASSNVDVGSRRGPHHRLDYGLMYLCNPAEDSDLEVTNVDMQGTAALPV